MYNFYSPKAHIYLEANYLESRKRERTSTTEGQSSLKTNFQAPNNSIRMVLPPKNPPSEPEKSILRTWTFSLLWSSTQRLQRVFLYLYTVCCRVVRPNKEGAFTPRKIIMSRKLIFAMVMIYLRMSFATASSYTMYFPHITRKSPFLQAWQDTTSIMYLLSIPKTFARGVKFDFRHCLCIRCSYTII